MFFGALIMLRNKLQISIRMLLFASLCLIGLAFMMMSFFEDFNFYLFAFAAIGVFLNISNIALMALFQKIVPNEVRGKVFGLLTSASVSSQPISYGVMGLLTDLVAPGTILLFCAVALALTAFRFLTIKELKQV
jgi:MFS family permease